MPDATLDLFSALLGGTLSAGGDHGRSSAATLPTDAPVNFTTTGAFGKLGPTDTLVAAPSRAAARRAWPASLLLPGSGTPINNYMRVHDARHRGARFPVSRPRHRASTSSAAPVIADVSGDGSPRSSRAATPRRCTPSPPAGAQAPGFPKFTTGWMVFGPSVGDLDGEGHNEVASTTREGYLMAWKTGGDADANQEWWSSHHDERNTGQYGIDTRPPGILRDACISAGGTTPQLDAPGDDWYAGTGGPL